MLPKPNFFVGKVPVYGDLILAPMAGFSDLPYRSICRSLGSSMSYTEFVNVDEFDQLLVDIQNGDEQGIDCGGTYCSPCFISSIDQQTISNNISVYPNPSDNSFTVSSNGNYIQYIKVINSLGEIVLTKEIKDSILATINLSHLKADIYYLQINLTNQTEVVKIIIK